MFIRVSRRLSAFCAGDCGWWVEVRNVRGAVSISKLIIEVFLCELHVVYITECFIEIIAYYMDLWVF